jgi:3-hydroxyisobutyrate dehydrogenase
MEIAWIGTGIMGAPMARRLLRAGHRVRVYNRTIEKARALLADGAVLASSAAEAAENADAVFIMVSDTPDVEQVITQIEPVTHRGQLVIDMSTISPAAERAIALRLAARGIDYLDAPVSGGDTGAAEGTLAIMVGGDAAAYERAMPLFNEMGKRIALMGPVGAGQMTKLANQIAVAIALEAACEALTFSRAGGLDPARVIEVIGAGAAGSWQLSNLGPRIIAGDYRPGFFVRLIRKDLRLISEAAVELGLALPALALVKSMFNTAAALGHDEDGTQALAYAVEHVAVVK